MLYCTVVLTFKLLRNVKETSIKIYVLQFPGGM